DTDSLKRSMSPAGPAENRPPHVACACFAIDGQATPRRRAWQCERRTREHTRHTKSAMGYGKSRLCVRFSRESIPQPAASAAFPVCLQLPSSHGDSPMMPRLILCLLLLWGAVSSLSADTSQVLGEWDSVTVPPVKTSIYVGSVTLTTGVFQREGD